jgi:heterodisulfide reductase subunit A
MVRGEDAQIGQVVEVEADLVVLATAVIAPKDNPALAVCSVCHTISMVICRKPIRSYAPSKQPKPVSSLPVVPRHPKDIPDTVAQASACAAKVCGLFAGDT